MKHKILIGVVIVIALTTLRLVLVHYRAEAMVETYRKQLAAQGEKLTIDKIAPHVTADEQASARNLLGAITLLGSISYSNYPITMRILSPGHALVSWAERDLPTEDMTNLWPSLRAQYQMHLQGLVAVRTALKQPVGEVKLDYAQGMMLLLPHVVSAKQATMWLSAAARLELHEGDSSNACEDLKACLALDRLLEREPLMISQLVRLAMHQTAIGATWEALQYTNWQDRQLERLQSSWESVDILSGVQHSLEMERITLQTDFAWVRLSYSNFSSLGFGASPTVNGLDEIMTNPKQDYEIAKDYLRYSAWRRGQSYEEEIYNMQVVQAGLEAVRRTQTNGAFAPTLKELDAVLLKHRKPGIIVNEGFKMDVIDQTSGEPGFLLNIEDGPLQTYLRKVERIEAERRLLVTAIALKRFQLAHGKYPAELSELTPAFLPAIPLDAMDGKPLRYHAKPDGTFLLYSVGEDGVDNGGDPTPTSKSTMWTETKDIVWPMPATAEEVGAYKKKMLDEWNAKHVQHNANRLRQMPASVPAK